MDNRPIGIFDSGVGGLTVLHQVIKALPYESTIYFGDTGRFPYGSKSKEIVLQYSKQIINFLKSHNAKAIIIACNTVGANCYQELKDEFQDIHIIDIVSSGAEEALNNTKNYKIGILATESTVKSLEYEKNIKKLNQNAKVFSVACPEFAPLAENGEINSSLTLKTAEKYLTPLLEKDIDTLVLGCTHYPLLIDSIKQILPKHIFVVDPAINVSRKIKILLQNYNMLNLQQEKMVNEFYVSQKNEKFDFMCSLILNRKYFAQNIDIEKY